MKLFLSAASTIALLAGSASAGDAARSFDIWQSTDAGKSVIAIAAVGDKAPFAAAAGADSTALDLLAADEASAAIAELRARTAEKTEMADKAAAESGAKTTGEKKIVEIVKMKHEDHSAHAPKEHADAAAHEGHAEATATPSAEGDAPHKFVLVKTTADAKEGKTEKKEVRRIIKLNSDKDMTDAEIAELVEKAKADMTAEGGEVAVEHGPLASDDVDAALLASARKVVVVENSKDGAATRLVSISGADIDGARAFIDNAEGLDEAEKAKIRTDLGL